MPKTGSSGTRQCRGRAFLARTAEGGCPHVFCFFYQVPFAPRPMDGLIIALVSIGISFVATIYPSWAASRILPAEALRYE